MRGGGDGAAENSGARRARVGVSRVPDVVNVVADSAA